jgi:uncharacterized protein YcbX
MHVVGLHVYPVKGARGLALPEAVLEPRGLAGDRRWMIVDADGTFLTQREEPRLAQLTVDMTTDGLRLTLPDGGVVEVKKPADDAPRRTVSVWRSKVSAPTVAAPALSAWLDQPVALAFMDAAARRHSNPDYAGSKAPVGFADGYAVLVTTQASLAALNAHISARGEPPVPMARFRPNIVIEGAEPWAESGWRRLRIGAAELELVKPCVRCVVTTTDQATGERMGKEPLASLAVLRRSTDRRASGVLFGENAVTRGAGVLRVGDAVEVLERQALWPVAAVQEAC